MACCIQYSKIEEVDKIYVFLAGINSKFYIACGHILGQRLVPSLMEVCSKVRLEEDCTSVMSSLTTPATDFVAFSAKYPSHDSERHNGKLIPIYEHCKKRLHTKQQCWKLHGRPHQR